MLRRFYRICFAHPAVEGIYMWGFWEGRHWREDAYLWERDWTPTHSAEAYMRLIDEEFRTTGDGRTNEQGKLKFRGFPGTYRIFIQDEVYDIRLSLSSPNINIERQ